MCVRSIFFEYVVKLIFCVGVIVVYFVVVDFTSHQFKTNEPGLNFSMYTGTDKTYFIPLPIVVVIYKKKQLATRHVLNAQ